MKRKKNWGGKLQFIGCRIEDILKILALLIRPIRIHSVTDLGSGWLSPFLNDLLSFQMIVSLDESEWMIMTFHSAPE